MNMEVEYLTEIDCVTSVTTGGSITAVKPQQMYSKQMQNDQRNRCDTTETQNNNGDMDLQQKYTK